MLLQSHTGIVQLFPAIPEGWKNVEFNNLRTEGAFLVSSKKENGRLTVEILAEKGGVIRIANPFGAYPFDAQGTNYIIEDNVISIEMKAGEKVLLKG